MSDEPTSDDALDDPACICPTGGTLDLLGRKYAIHLVCAANALGPVRFSDLEDVVPEASTSTVSTRLDELEAEGVVARTVYDEVPPRVEYELTADGRELASRLEPLVAWERERT